MPTMTFPPMRFMARLLIALLLVSMAGTALAAKKRSELDKNQYAYSAAIRWGDFEGAWTMVDPKVRKAKPMSDVDFSRYEQIQVTAYRDLATMPGPDGSLLREIQIELVNRNTLSQRRVRFTEVWRYDPEAKTWWVAGLPDFWQGK
jgi:hypothetical protein